MTDPRTKVRSFLLVVLVVVGMIPAASVAPVAMAATGNDDPGNTPGDDPGNTPGDDPADAPDTFHVQQAGQCYEVGALGDGTESVEDFYDYRNNETDPQSYDYSSFGTTDLQDNQESKLLMYNGSEGYSLVIIHDKYALDGGDGSNASTVTFELSGVGEANWTVQDDTYGNDTQDDNWDTAGNTHDIDWKWGSNRTDGGALTGIAGETITIDPGFNENADAWGSWDNSGDDRHKIDDWAVIDGSGEYRLEQSLDMTENVTIKAGTCSDASSPNADLTASPNPAANDEAVTLDASGTTDEDGDVKRYHWDFDGDGQIDERTTEATVQHAYDEPGDYEASVTVVDKTHKQDTATTTVEVVNSSAPAVTVNAPEEVAVDHEFGLSADARADKEIQSYEWDFNGTTKSGQEVTHSYSEMGNYSVTLSWTTESGESGSETVTIEATVGTITYLNATAVRVNGTFDVVSFSSSFYDSSGIGTSFGTFDDVSGSTLIDISDEGVNGTVITNVEANVDRNDSETDLSKEHPRLDYYSEAIKPEDVNVSVESVTEADNGTYEVTFGYDNRNDETLNYSDSTLSGEVSDDAPQAFSSGNHTFTVTWTPDSGKEYLTWTVDRSNFDQSPLNASTPPARVLGGNESGSESPDAAVSVPDKLPIDEPLQIDASESSDDMGVVWYKYYVDGDLLWAGNPDSTPEETWAQPWNESQFPDGPDTYRITAKVWDAEGQSDKASDTVTIKSDDDKLTADISVTGTTEVGEEVTFEATGVTEDSDSLERLAWKLNGETVSDGETWTTAFEKSGQKTVTLVLKDRAGNYNEVEKTISIDSADSGDGGDDGKDDDSGEGGLEDPDNRDSRSGGIPGADPGDSNDERPLEDAPRNVSENLTDDDGRFGSVVVTADDGSEVTVEVHDTAPSGIPAPTPAQDGFEAVSFLTADGADRATVTVASDRLDSLDATPENVSLFRYDNGTWTAVDTTVANATGDDYRFRANVTNGTYAVGVERPAIGVANVNVRDGTVAPGEAATVAVTVENAGLANGTDEVSLVVGGDAVATETVSLSAGEWTTLRFAPTFASAGTYEVTVGDATAEIVVESVETETTTTTETTSPEDPATETTTTDESTGSIPGFGVGVALVALLASALLALRRR